MWHQACCSSNNLSDTCPYAYVPLQALRDGQVKVMDAENIVPGDVLLVRLGDIVPADIKLLGSDDGEEHAPMQVKDRGWGLGAWQQPRCAHEGPVWAWPVLAVPRCCRALPQHPPGSDAASKVHAACGAHTLTNNRCGLPACVVPCRLPCRSTKQR